MLDRAAALQRERASSQSSLFGEDSGVGVAVTAPPLPDVPPWPARERSSKEKEVLGFYFSDHPLAPMREQIEKVATHRAVDAAELEDGAEVRIVGIVGEMKTFVTRNGRKMASVMIEDLSGRIECTVFPDAFDASQELLTADTIVVGVGRMESNDRGTRLLLSEIKRFDEAQSLYRRALVIEVRSDDLSLEWLDQVDDVLSSHPGDAEVYLVIVMPDSSRKASRSRRYRVGDDDRVVGSLAQRFPFVRVRWGKGVA